MTTCPVCFLTYSEAEPDCPRCRLRAAEPVAPSPAAPATSDSEALDAALARLGLGAAAEAPDLVATPDDPPAQPSPEPEPDAPPPAGFGHGDVTPAELQALRSNGRFAVMLMGFSTAGKTFFLERLKHHCVNSADAYVADDRHPVRRTGDLVQGTDFVEIHGLTSNVARKVPDLAVIDIPGERFRRAGENGFREEPVFLEAMRAAQALLIVLPAADVLFAERAATRLRAGLAGDAGDWQSLLDQAARPAGPGTRGGRARTIAAEDALALVARPAARPTSESEREAVRRATARAIAAARAAADRTPAASLSGAARRKAERVLADEAAALADRAARMAFRRDLLDLAFHAEPLEAFVAGIGRLAITASLLDQGRGLDQILTMTGGERAAHVRSQAFKGWVRQKPVFVALSKADELNIVPGEIGGRAASFQTLLAGDEASLVRLDRYDEDPLETVLHFRDILAHQVHAWFGWAKLDFVTAFEGHDGTQVVDFSRRHYGVRPAVEWISWACDYSRWSPRRRKAVQAGAFWRRLRDGELGLSLGEADV